MTKHFSLTVSALNALENVAKRHRSRFVSDAINSYAKKKNIFDDYNNEIKKDTTLSNEKKVDGKASTTANSKVDKAGYITDNQINFDDDF